MVVPLDAKRRLTVPTALAPAKPGDHFDAHFDVEEDAIVFRRLAGRENWLAVLKAWLRGCHALGSQVSTRHHGDSNRGDRPTDAQNARADRRDVPPTSIFFVRMRYWRGTRHRRDRVS
jgi:hypothetical protein